MLPSPASKRTTRPTSMFSFKVTFRSSTAALWSSTAASPLFATESARSWTTATKPSDLATKSVSHFSSTMAATVPAWVMATAPWAFSRPVRSAALPRPFSRSHFTAASKSPSFSCSARFASIIPAPVDWRRVWTSLAVNSAISSLLLGVGGAGRCGVDVSHGLADGLGLDLARFGLDVPLGPDCFSLDRLGRRVLDRRRRCVLGCGGRLGLGRGRGLVRRGVRPGLRFGLGLQDGLLASGSDAGLAFAGGLGGQASRLGLLRGDLRLLVGCAGRGRAAVAALAGGDEPALVDRVGDDATHQRPRPDGVVVAGNHVLDDVGIAVGVDHCDHRDAELVGLGDRDVLLLRVQDEHRLGQLLHVPDALEVALELLELAGDDQRFLLGHGVELAGVA